MYERIDLTDDEIIQRPTAEFPDGPIAVASESLSDHNEIEEGAGLKDDDHVVEKSYAEPPQFGVALSL